MKPYTPDVHGGTDLISPDLARLWCQDAGPQSGRWLVCYFAPGVGEKLHIDTAWFSTPQEWPRFFKVCPGLPCSHSQLGPPAGPAPGLPLPASSTAAQPWDAHWHGWALAKIPVGPLGPFLGCFSNGSLDAVSLNIPSTSLRVEGLSNVFSPHRGAPAGVLLASISENPSIGEPRQGHGHGTQEQQARARSCLLGPQLVHKRQRLASETTSDLRGRTATVSVFPFLLDGSF